MSVVSAYQEFLDEKAPRVGAAGMANVPELPVALKPFQKAIVGWALRRGRAALFEATGLGKTIQQLSWARAVVDHVGSPILVLTPLAVAEQTIAEAARFGIANVAYAADKRRLAAITVTNYERFDKFDMRAFCGIVLDESGILKSHDGKTRAMLTEACADTPWRLCCTATPAPNDYTELGQHAEFLGVMRAAEMLSMFFVHDGSIRANEDAGTDGWRLKRHARRDFWAWLASWSVMIRSPEDLAFDGTEYRLPLLRYHQVTVPAEYTPTAAGMLFPVEANTLGERIGVRRDTVEARIDAAVRIVSREPEEPWLIWCHLNSEADGIEKRLAAALQVKGSHPASTKVERLLGFKSGNPLYLISKPSIAGHGMNYQHCARQIMIGLTDSFEELFQAVRRCWRFGQIRPVEIYLIASELEGAVVANLRRKEANFDAMLDEMAGHMRDLMQENVRGQRQRSADYAPTIPMEIPRWLVA